MYLNLFYSPTQIIPKIFCKIEHIKMCNIHQDVVSIFKAAVLGVSPNTMVGSVLARESDSILTVKNMRYPIRDKSRVYLVGFGKAVIGMARSVQDILRGILRGGIVIVPHGTLSSLIAANRMDLIPRENGIRIFEGARDNLPDNDAVTATKKVIDLVSTLSESDILFVLVSGGGSALLTAPLEPVTLDDKRTLTKLLAGAGADITELNDVRKQVSATKGGKLGLLAHPAQVITLILSDVIGDPLDQIGSGPTVPSSTPQDAWSVIQKYGLEDKTPVSIVSILRDGLRIVAPPSGSDLKHIDNYLIGNNELALRAAECRAKNEGYETCILSDAVCGHARSFGRAVAELARLVVDHRMERKLDVPIAQLISNLADHGIGEEAVHDLLTVAKQRDRVAVLSGGETVVHVVGHGRGGRNQEAALACSIALDDLFHRDDSRMCGVAFLSAGTDGIDGPTAAAGAIAYLGQAQTARDNGFIPEDYLNDNDSNGFFTKSNVSDLIVTGVTGTNVMDIHVLLLQFESLK